MLRSSRRRLLQQQIDAMNERIATLENDNREFRAQLHEAQRRLSVMADDDPNKKDGGMSQGVATIYRALFEELRFAKQQQWMTTNYLLVVLAAIFGIGKAIEHLTVCEKVIATFLLLTAVGFGYYVLMPFEEMADGDLVELFGIDNETLISQHESVRENASRSAAHAVHVAFKQQLLQR